MVGLHATDPASIFMEAWARTKGVTPEDVESELYESRSVVRMLGMRRTMFVVDAADVAMVEAAATRAIAARERARLLQWIAESGRTDGARWLRRLEKQTVSALEARGEATAAQLATDVPELREKLLIGAGKWATEVGMSTRVVLLLAADGHIVRGRPVGTWISTQHRWRPADPLEPLPVDEARAALVRRWLGAFGPGTVEDLKWWTGLTLGQVRKALAEVEVVEVDLGGRTALVLADDVEPVKAVKPMAALLPTLDATPMGWKEREWYVGDHEKAMFDRSGNIGPTIWWDGRIVGGWAQRKDGEIAVRYLEDVGAVAQGEVAKLVESLTEWLGETRFVPRFRSPLERELSDR